MFKIFPAYVNQEGQKVPLIKDWFNLATNDQSKIQEWVNTFGSRITIWGIPCGETNGIYVLDIDVKKVNGWNSLKEMGHELPTTLYQHTPSGGSHLFFKAKPGVHYPNSVNSKLGLDTRGDKGWVAHYGFVNPGTPLADAPEWLSHLSPKKEEVKATGESIGLSADIAFKVFNEALDNIRNAPEGESNNTLNIEAYRVGQLIVSGALQREFAEAGLFKAAKERGKPDYEAKATIKSGIDGGIKHPLTSPFSAPVLQIDMPIVPPAPERWTPTYLTRHDLLNVSKLKKPQLFQDWSTEDIHITTADGGTGKTTLKLYEAICLALGERFLGFDCKQKGKTLFITGEDTDKKIAAMIGAIVRQMGLFEESVDNDEKINTIVNSIVIKKDSDLCLIQKDKQGFIAMNKDALRKVMEAVDDIKPKMIVFDPIASFWGSESALNDMSKAVTTFMSELAERSNACVEMINHMGKASSNLKDMSQFAGRGGSALPSHSRVSRVMRAVEAPEYQELVNEELPEGESAILVNVNKFTDGSPLYNKPFIVVRKGYLFYRKTLIPTKERELDKQLSDIERVFSFVKKARESGKYPTRSIVVSHFMTCGDTLSEARTKRALDMLQYSGHMNEKLTVIDNPDQTIKDKALIVTDMEGKEH